MKRLNKKGFTLAELLIVIAIMAILIAIAIPAFSAQLEKTRQAVDDGNMRSAMSESVATYLLDGESEEVTYHAHYDAAAKSIKVDKAAFTANDKIGQASANKDKGIQIVVKDGEVKTATWVEIP